MEVLCPKSPVDDLTYGMTTWTFKGCPIEVP